MSEWHIAVKLADQPLAPKSILRLPETELGECPLGGCSISHLKQLITGKLQESVPDPELIGRCTGRGQLLPSCGSAEGGSKLKLCESLPWGFLVLPTQMQAGLSSPHFLRTTDPSWVCLYVFVFSIDLIYCGRKLRDDQTLEFYGIQSGSTVHVLRKSWPEPDQKPGGEEVGEGYLGCEELLFSVTCL